jgi:hypothetical protein
MVQQYRRELVNVPKTEIVLRWRSIPFKGLETGEGSIVVELTLPVGLLLGRFELPNQPDAEG